MYMLCNDVLSQQSLGGGKEANVLSRQSLVPWISGALRPEPMAITSTGQGDPEHAAPLRRTQAVLHRGIVLFPLLRIMGNSYAL
jgi:hypothetical protein